MDKYCRKSIILVLLVIIAITIAGCGGGGGSNSGANTSQVASLVLDETETEVLIDGGTHQFEATALNSSGKEISGLKLNWAVDKTDFGTIDAAGKFIAGNKTGTCKVTCMVGGKTATATINIGTITDAGKLIVNDLTSFGSIGKTMLNSKTKTLVDNTKKSIIPHLAHIESAWDVISRFGYNPSLLRYIFTHPAGTIAVESDPNSSNGTLYKGPWTVTFTDKPTWKATYRRSVEGDNDIVEVIITSTKDTALTYKLTQEYPTALMANASSVTSASFAISGSLVDSILETSTFKGTVKGNVNEKTSYNGDFNGEMKYKFKGVTNDFLNFNGGLSLYFDTLKEDYLTGKIETADLTISGALKLNYVANEFEEFKVFPKSYVLEGSIAGNGADPVKLDGKLAINVSNGADFNEEKGWSDTNYLLAKLEFNGAVVIDNSYQFETSLTAQSLSASHYKMDYILKLNSGGKGRTLTLNLENTDDRHLHFVCESTLGRAKLDVMFAFNDVKWHYDTWADASGTLTVNGTKSTVTKTDKVIKIDFYNGMYTKIPVGENW